MSKGMTRTDYVKCTNPGCGKLNPVQLETGGEYTCMFCGRPFTPHAEAIHAEKTSFKKRSRGKKPLNPSVTRPENRNTRKPMI